MFVETFSKARLILWREFPLGMGPDLIDHSTKINQTVDLFAGTTQAHIFHRGSFA